MKVNPAALRIEHEVQINREAIFMHLPLKRTSFNAKMKRLSHYFFQNMVQASRENFLQSKEAC